MNNTMRRRQTVRWVMVVVGLALGAVLIMNGSLIVGALIATMAVLRVALLLSPRRGRTGAPGSEGGSARQPLRELVPEGFRAAATAIGVDLTILRREFAGGKSIAEVATESRVPVDDVVRSMVGDVSLAIDHAVTAGTMSSRDATVARSRLPQWANRLVTMHREDLQRLERSVGGGTIG